MKTNFILHSDLMGIYNIGFLVYRIAGTKYTISTVVYDRSTEGKISKCKLNCRPKQLNESTFPIGQLL